MTPALTIESPAYFDRLAEVEARHWWSLGMWRLASYWLDGALGGRSGLRGLDVGCGTGLTAVQLSRRPEITTVVGLDPSPEALCRARPHGLPLVRGSALALPFASGQFDVVTCFDVMQHLPPGGDHRAASELRRVLSPGGVVVVRSNARGWSGDGSSYRLADLVDVVSAAGLKVRLATHANALPAIAQEIRGRFSGRGGSAGHPSGGGLRIRVPGPTANRLMGMISGAEAWVSGRLRVPLPFGHSTLVLAQRPLIVDGVPQGKRGIPDSRSAKSSGILRGRSLGYYRTAGRYLREE